MQHCKDDLQRLVLQFNNIRSNADSKDVSMCWDFCKAQVQSDALLIDLAVQCKAWE